MEAILSIFDDFMDVRSHSRIPAAFDKKNFAFDNKEPLIQSIEYISNDKGEFRIDPLSDFCMALRWNHNMQAHPIKTILCEVVIGRNVLHTITLTPNKIEWILNGTPLLFICTRFQDVKLHFCDIKTSESISGLNVTMFNVLLSSDARRNLICPNGQSCNIICNLSDDRYISFCRGMGKSCNNNEFQQIQSHQKRNQNYQLIVFPSKEQFVLRHPARIMIYDNLLKGGGDIVLFIQSYGFPSLQTPHALYHMVIDDVIKQLKYYERVGDKLTIGTYKEGEYIGEHRDGSLQGGDFSMILYFDEPREGGEIVFGSQIISTNQSRCIVFSVNELHHTLPVISGRKTILGCELVLKKGPKKVERYDYLEIKERMNIVKEEMMMQLFHPKNIDKFSGWGF